MRPPETTKMTNTHSILKEIKSHRDNFYIIHYSCQSLYDDNEGLSPRVTSIVILSLCNRQTLSFSTHATAEEIGISKDEVTKYYDDIERKILEKFFEFIRDRRDKKWLHWNMNNLIYGFEHIEHRYRTLTGNIPTSIPIENRINIDSIFREKYGKNYAKKPKMSSLLELNGGPHRSFLTGLEEVEAFKRGEYIRMHNSTLFKVNFFEEAIDLCIRNKLKTDSNNFLVKIDRLYESRIAKIIGTMTATVGLIGAIIGFIK